jgi:drug/metabolite transporter (DMT)-like permease
LPQTEIRHGREHGHWAIGAVAIDRHPVAALIASGYRPPRSWTVAVLLGVLEPGLSYLREATGLTQTGAVDGSLISGLEPALVVLLAALLLREAIGISAVAAVVVGLGGVALIMDSGGATSAIGDLLLAAGVLAASLYSIRRQALRRRCGSARRDRRAVHGSVDPLHLDPRWPYRADGAMPDLTAASGYWVVAAPSACSASVRASCSTTECCSPATPAGRRSS